MEKGDGIREKIRMYGVLFPYGLFYFYAPNSPAINMAIRTYHSIKIGC